jgi:hypothetical protein
MLQLKSIPEIKQSIISYLQNLVDNFNKKLNFELSQRNSFYSAYKVSYDKLREAGGNNLDVTYFPHSYKLLDKNFFVNLI